MATIKSYTDLEQSHKLAEILPIESADMVYVRCCFEDEGEYSVLVGSYHGEYAEREDGTLVPVFDEYIPCWSLAALLDILPPSLFEYKRGIDLNVYPNLNGKGWHCSYMPNSIENMKIDKFKLITSGDSLVDACVAMIEKLHKIKVL